MSKNKNTQPQNLFQYINWLYQSGRITKEEHSNLFIFAKKLEEDTEDLWAE